MKVTCFRLSGHDIKGPLAESLYRKAAAFGFETVTASRYADGTRGRRRDGEFSATADVSGVSAWVELSFDSCGEMLAWAGSVTVVSAAEPRATECYRALIAVLPSKEEEDAGEAR